MTASKYGKPFNFCDFIIPASYHAKSLKKKHNPWYVLLHIFTTRPSFKNTKNLNVVKNTILKACIFGLHPPPRYLEVA